MPVAPNTSSSMIVRTASNPTYTIYNLGQNQILLGQDVITSNQLGSDFNFAGPGAVMWDFNQFTLDLWVSHPSTMEVGGSGGTTFSVPVTQFVVYNINGNTITNSSILGNIGQEWQVQGFGYFFRSDLGQADMLTRNVSNNTATYLAYDTESNQFNSSITAAVVGANFNNAGLGAYFTLSGSTFAQLMVLSDGAGGLRACHDWKWTGLGGSRVRSFQQPVWLKHDCTQYRLHISELPAGVDLRCCSNCHRQLRGPTFHGCDLRPNAGRSRTDRSGVESRWHHRMPPCTSSRSRSSTPVPFSPSLSWCTRWHEPGWPRSNFKAPTSKHSA